MRIAIDATNLAHDRRGMGRAMRTMSLGLLREPDADVTFVTRRLRDVSLVAAAFGERSVRVESADRVARRGAFDVVWLPFNGMTFACAAPVVVTIHDAFAFTEPHRDLVARYREQQPIRRAASAAARIVTDSQWSRGEIVRELRVPQERVVAIPLVPDPFWTSGTSVDAFPELQSRRAVTVVGAGEPRKNARMLVDACATALDPAREVLVFVGAVTDDVRAHAATRRVPFVHIDADDDRLRALYRNASAVVVPSLAEGFGLVAVEAMACGAPVIASNATALPEATGGGALLVDPRDTSAWATAIRRVLDDPVLAADLRERGFARTANEDRDLPARELYAVLALVTAEATRQRSRRPSRETDR
jgi:glycosyltransferase involved in cell wall biosynthesis